MHGNGSCASRKKAMRSNLGKTAIAVGLLCTWDTPSVNADSYAFEGSITPAQTLSNAYFIFATGFCNSVVYAHKLADAIPGGVTTPLSFVMEMDAGQRHDSTLEPYGEFQTIFAIYDDANDGVSIAYNSTAASKILAEIPVPEWTGSTLPIYLSNVDDVGSKNVGVTESQIATLLRTGGITNWGGGFDFFWDFPVLSPPRMANHPSVSDFTLVNFSPATNGGSLTLSEVAIPEPSSGILIAIASLFRRLLPKRRA